MDIYSKALEFYLENNIYLNKSQLLCLEINLEYPEAYEPILESANSNIAEIFKQMKIKFKDLNKQYKTNIKSGNIPAAKKNLQDMLIIINDSEKQIRSIDASKWSDKFAGFFRVYALQIAVILVTYVLTYKVTNKKFTSRLKDTQAALHQDAYDQTVYALTHGDDAEKFKANMSRTNKLATKRANRELVAKGFTDSDIKDMAFKASDDISTGALNIGVAGTLLSSIKSLKQMANDKKAAKSDQEKSNAGNIYREKILSVLTNMKKSIAVKLKQLDNAK